MPQGCFPCRPPALHVHRCTRPHYSSFSSTLTRYSSTLRSTPVLASLYYGTSLCSGTSLHSGPSLLILCVTLASLALSLLPSHQFAPMPRLLIRCSFDAIDRSRHRFERAPSLCFAAPSIGPYVLCMPVPVPVTAYPSSLSPEQVGLSPDPSRVNEHHPVFLNTHAPPKPQPPRFGKPSPRCF